jgi:Domain of unknown function (DUF1127)
MQEVIMSTLLTDKTTAELPWTLAYPQSTGRNLFKAVKKTITVLVANRLLRNVEAELMALDDRMLKDIGLDRQRDWIDADRPRAGAQKWRAAAALVKSCKRRVARSATEQWNPRSARHSVARRRDTAVPVAGRLTELKELYSSKES